MTKIPEHLTSRAQEHPSISEYDERPGYPKGNQGGFQQGHLFRNEAPARGQGRYPNGYTPDRMREVQANMPNVGNINGLTTMGVPFGNHPDDRMERDHTARAYARSSVP